MAGVIDPVSGVVSIVDTVLTRIDAREAKLKERTDVRDALLDLLHAIRTWARAAARTNELIAQLIVSEQRPPDRTFEINLTEASMRNIDAGLDVAALHGTPALATPGSRPLRGKRGRPRSTAASPPAKAASPRSTAAMSDVLFAYAPELEAFFEEIISFRLRAVEQVYERLRQSSHRPVSWRALFVLFGVPQRPATEAVVATDLDVNALKQSQQDLEAAAERLAGFIADRFEVETLRIGPAQTN
jgi:hypothetical protein